MTETYPRAGGSQTRRRDILAARRAEAIRLAAVKEAFDRMLGKAPIAADVTTTKFDLGAAYLAALKLANLPPAEAAIDVTPEPDAPAGAEFNSTTDW